MGVSLFSALNVGDRALRAISVALQVTGQNIANATTEGYHRQRVDLRPAQPTDMVAYQIGSGVEVRRIERVIDHALEQLVLESRSALGNLETLRTTYLRLEGVFNELSDADLSSALDRFFAAVEDLSQMPEDSGTRNAVIAAGTMLADAFGSLVHRINLARSGEDAAVRTAAEDINGYLKDIAELNRQIVIAEDAGLSESEANDLRDRRDSVIEKLSEMLEVTVIEQASGTVSVYAGSDALVFGSTAQNLKLTTTYDNGVQITKVTIESTGQMVDIHGGRIAGLVDGRDSVLGAYLDEINKLAGEFIYAFNLIHSEGNGLIGFRDLTSSNFIEDVSAPLNIADLDFEVVNGSFDMTTVNEATGEKITRNITVDLDGIGSNDTSLQALANEIQSQFNISADPNNPQYLVKTEITGGHIRITTISEGISFVFGNDSSGALAALGLNTFFSGHDAWTISVNPVIEGNPDLVAAAQSFASGDNSNAQRLAALRHELVMENGTRTFEGFYEELVGKLGAESASVQNQYASQQIMTDQILNERDAISGVSIDEETVNLMTYQRAYQASARYIAIVNDLLETLISLA
ncbi:MAG: flagellar hook-associated protein FlgK [Planctomycetota bacterium]|jgi:flagellar hook-associated protein 1 FlgK